MNNCGKTILTIGLAVSLQLGLYPTIDIALSATAPVASIRSAITTGASTPVRLFTDSAGSIYATDQRAGGIMKYDTDGSVHKIITSKSGGGVAIAQDGKILVSQGTYVAVINPDGTPFTQFGTFKYANGIAIDNLNNIYVTDSSANRLYKFTSTYAPDPTKPFLAITVPGSLGARPSGIAYDKFNNRLAIANALGGNIQFINPATMLLIENVGIRNTNNYEYTPPVYPATPEFTYPQGVSFEYEYNTATPPAIIGVKRIYVAETFQANIQVLDGVSPYNRIADIGGYGFVNGKLYVPSDVLIARSPSSPYDTRLIVANGTGALSVWGLDVITNYNVTLTTTSGGSITGTGPVAGNISLAENSSKTWPIPANGSVDLTATPGSSYVFDKWTGECAASLVNTCSFIMTANKTAGASFKLSAPSPFYVGSTGYSDLQLAYNVPGVSEIKVMVGTWAAAASGTFTAGDATKTVTIKGGYTDIAQPQTTGATIITGRVNVKAGKVIMNNVRVK
jgi:hypothetical protein